MNATYKKTLTAALAALTLGATVLSTATPASARNGGAIAAGIIGGLALGALAAGAAHAAPGYYAPSRVYGGCWMERRPVFNRWGDVVGYRRTRVCESAPPVSGK